MSLPQFPTISPPLTRGDALNQIISSIASEELGLSHVINAEGEKLQFLLGTIPGLTGGTATIEDVLDANETVQATLDSIVQNQVLLGSKLSSAVSSPVVTGPTGATGASIYPQPQKSAWIRHSCHYNIKTLEEIISLPAFLFL